MNNYGSWCLLKRSASRCRGGSSNRENGRAVRRGVGRFLAMKTLRSNAGGPSWTGIHLSIGSVEGHHQQGPHWETEERSHRDQANDESENRATIRKRAEK